MAAEKHRYAAFLVYPDSAPQGWWETLKKSHGQFARSLHAPDSDCSKPHYHVMYCHGNSTTDKALVAAIPEGIAANGYIEIITRPRQYMRYLIHLDDPEKEQFEDGRAHIDVLNGFPLDLSREYTSEERKAQRAGVFDYVRDRDITEYCDLLDMLAADGLEDLFDFACDHSILYGRYLDSRRYKRAIEKQHAKAREEAARLADDNWSR